MVGYAIVETESYGLNVGRWRREHPGWIIAIGFEGFGYRARRTRGGPWLSALTLDELDALISEKEVS